MASRPRAKVWNEKQGCFTDDDKRSTREEPQRSQGSAQRRNNTRNRAGQNEERYNDGRGQQTGGNLNQNRGNDGSQNQGHFNDRGQNQGRQNDRGQNQGRHNDRGPNQGPYNDRGLNQGPYNDRGLNQGPYNNRGQNQGRQNDRGQNQGPYNDRGPNQGPYNDRGPNQGPYTDRGPNQGPYNDRGLNQGPYNNRGQNQGRQNDRGQNQGPYNDRGPNQGPYNDRGPNQGPYNDRGQNQGRHNDRGQNRGFQNNRGQSRGQGYQQNEGQFNRELNGNGDQGGFFQDNHGRGQPPMHPNQQMGLLPDRMQPYMMQPGPIIQPVIMQPVYGSYQQMPQQQPQYPPSLMNVPTYPNEGFINNDCRDQGNQNRGNTRRRNENMERSHSTMSIDSVGSGRSDQQRQDHGNRNRNMRGKGRGGQHNEGQHRPTQGNMGRSQSTMSIDSVGSHPDDREVSRNTNFRGRGRGHNNHDRGRAGEDLGARPKQVRNRSYSGQDNRSRDGDFPEGGNRGSHREPNVDNQPNNKDFGRGGRRGGRRGRVGGSGRFFRGNRRPIDIRYLSENSDRQSGSTVSEDSETDRGSVNANIVRGRGAADMRRFQGRGIRGGPRGRGRGGRNILQRQMNRLDNFLSKDMLEVAQLGKNETSKELFERFFRGGHFGGRVPFRGVRAGRGRFFRGRWMGFVGNRKKTREEETTSTIGDIKSDDEMSISSEMSRTNSSVPDTKSVKSQEGKRFEICLNDIYTVKLHTLRNRVKRYRRNLTVMKNNNEDKDEIKKYQDDIEIIRNAIQKREASEKKEMDRKNVDTEIQRGKKGNNKENDKNLEEKKSSSEESEEEIKLKTFPTKSVRMHGVTSIKGHVSFKPKTKKTAKVKSTIKAPATKVLDIVDKSDTELTDTDNQEDPEDKEEDKKVKKKRIRNRNKKNKKLVESKESRVDEMEKEERQKVLQGLLSRFDTFTKDKEMHEESIESHLSMKPRGSSLSDSLGSRSRGSSLSESNASLQMPPQQSNIPSTGEDLKPKSSETHGRARNSSNSKVPDVNEVFKFMVKTLDGKGTPEEIKRESGLFPIDFDEIGWFRKLKRRFTIIERNGTVELVLVSNRDATYCLDYITNRSCTKDDCKRYHVCKNFLAGKCVYGDKCKFSHDLLDERNLSISKRLGYSNVFSNDEICAILRVRYPHICQMWIENGSCDDLNCIYLHLCPRYILGQCLDGETCSLIHDKCSDHNKPIVDAYSMGNWVESIFQKMVYMIRQPTGPEENTAVRSEHVIEPLEGAPSRRDRQELAGVEQISLESEDSANDTAICERYLVDQCQSQRCKYLHCRTISPYVWQVKLYGTWISLSNLEEIERNYCDNKEFSEEIRLVHNDMEFSVVIVYKPQIRAVAVVIGTQDGGIHTDARRLSCLSYKQDGDDSNTFKTQWRWYWCDDLSQWKVFDQDAMQHTLEAKFLAKQKDFNYCRENYRFKYIVDFNTMTQRNIGTKKVREINRRPLFVSQHNVRRGQFPSSLSAAPVVETSLPTSWLPWDLANPFELVSLDENSSVFREVSDCFYKTLDRGQIEIDAIFRMQNHKLWSLYCNQEKSMLANLKRLGKEELIDSRYLFHGTDSLDAVRGISINNFDARVSGKNATVYGDGAYFATDAKYSHAYTKGPERFMFMVKVLVGDYTLGNRSYRRPPNKPGSDHELFDSCVNDINSPSIFIVFDKNQYYPEYLIQYHKLFEDFETIEAQTISRPHRVSSRPSNFMSGVSGAVGGVNISTPRPAVAPARRRSPSPPIRAYYPASNSDFNTVNPTSGGHTSARYVSDMASPSPAAGNPVRSPVSPKKKDDSSCSIQ